MICINILYIVILNVLCFGHRFSPTDIELKKNYKLNTQASIKDVLLSHGSLANKNTSDFQYNGLNLKDNNYDSSEVAYINDDHENQNKPKKKMTNFPLKITNDRVYRTTTCHKRTSKGSSCQHIHLHFNGTRSEERTVWRFSCLFLFALLIIIVLLLNCFHYHFGIAVYYKKIEESECLDEDINTTHETKCLLGTVMP